jgi:hypothetical protein
MGPVRAHEARSPNWNRRWRQDGSANAAAFSEKDAEGLWPEVLIIPA